MLTAVLRALASYQPLVAGTMPLGVHIDSSDVDIICHAPDLDAFAAHLASAFVGAKIERAPSFVTASFEHDGTRIEIYGEPRAVYEQHAFRHMLVEARLLRIGGDALRARVRAEKRAGASTEAAFARVLHIAGDPYEALLALEPAGDDVLRVLIATR